MKGCKFKGEIWIYPSENAAWHFVTLDKKTAEDIDKKYKNKKRGFGSLPVEVQIGETK